MSNTKFDVDVDVDLQPPEGYQNEPKKKTKAQNIGGLFSNKKTRNIIVACVIILGAFGILATLVLKAPKQNELAPELKGVNAGLPPTSMSKDKAAAESPRFDEMAQNRDKKNLEEAVKTGESVQPTATGAYKYTSDNTNQVQPEPSYRTNPNQQQVNTAEVEARRVLVAATNAAIARNIALWDAEKSPKMLHAADSVVANQLQNPVGANQGNVADQKTSTALVNAANQGAQSVTLIKSGFLGPIRIDVPLNSDEPNAPAVATLLSGPFMGAKLIGKYSKNMDDTLTATFTSMSIPTYGITVPVNAVTVNPEDKTRQGIATDVDQHLILKYGLKPLAQALSAVGNAYAKQSTTTVNIGNGGPTITQTPPITAKTAGYIGMGAAAGQFSQDVGSQRVESTVSVESDAVVGVVFLSDVIYTPLKKLN